MSSEQGNAGSPESGRGETADRAGDKQLSPGPTGQPGQGPGPGSQTGESAQGQEQTQQGAPPQDPSAQSDAGQNSPNPQTRPSQPDKRDSSGGMSSGPPQGGGLPGDDLPLRAEAEPHRVPDADEANLEYARQATDLVLERLKDQQQDPDPELLKSLGWTAGRAAAVHRSLGRTQAGGARRRPGSPGRSR